MNGFVTKERDMVEYYIRNIKAINDEMNSLIKTDNVQNYLEIQKTDEVREYIKLQDEKEFCLASLNTHRDNLATLLEDEKEKNKTL